MELHGGTLTLHTGFELYEFSWFLTQWRVPIGDVSNFRTAVDVGVGLVDILSRVVATGIGETTEVVLP